MGNGRDGYEETEYMGEENIKRHIRTDGRARNVESKNWSAIEGDVQRFRQCRRY